MTAAGRDPVDAVHTVDVLVVGGGPAGAAVAADVAAAGRSVALVERRREWRWRACGVFSSPVTLRELRRLGVASADLDAVTRSIPQLWVESPSGERFALTYGRRADGDPTAIGFDRSRLDPLLMDLAARRGAEIHRGTTFRGLRRIGDAWRVSVRDGGGECVIGARIVVGADGVGSGVAGALGVARRTPLPRVGLTFHIRSGRSDSAREDGRMVVRRDAYVGLAPVPGGRINVGIVLAGATRRRALAEHGAATIADRLLGDVAPELDATPLDAIAGIAPIAHRVGRRAGDGWLLVGDAAGFLDPFTGEGLHRALVSARLASHAILRRLDGGIDALAAYDAAMAHRFRAKDLVSWVVQAFVTQPALFDYAAGRLARRSCFRERLGLVLGDLMPGSDAFDPRFLVGLLRP